MSSAILALIMNLRNFLRNGLGLLVAVLLSIGAFADVERGVIVRRFLYQVVSASGVSKPELGIRKALAKSPEILTWLAEGVTPDALLTDAGFEGVRLESIWKPILEEAANVSIEQIATELSPLREQLTPILKPRARAAAEWFAKQPERERIAMLELAGPNAPRLLARKVNHVIETFPIQNLPIIQVLLDPQNGINLKGLNKKSEGAGSEHIRVFISSFFRYFSSLDIELRRPIVLGLLKLHPEASQADQVAAVFQNLGPGFQKMLQFIAKDFQNPELREAANKLLESVEPVSGQIARRIFERSTGLKINDVFSRFEDVPIKAATTGQVHLAVLRSTGETVVVKILRPGIRARAERELSVLDVLLAGSSLENTAKEIRKSLTSELNYKTEDTLLDAGQVYREPSLGIEVISRVKEIPATDSVLVLSFAAGRSLHSIRDLPPLERGKVLERLLWRWFDVAVFQNGFFHGDLHAGNIFVDTSVNRQKPLITLIDFGNAGQMTLLQRQGFLRLAAGLLGQNPEQIAGALRDVCQLKASEYEGLLSAIRGLDLKGLSLTNAVGTVLAATLEQNLTVPTALMQFYRGIRFLERQIEEVNLELERIDPTRRMKRFSPLRIYLKLGVLRTAESVPKELFGLGAANESVVSTEVLRELFIAGVRQVGRQFIGMCQKAF